MVAGVAAALGAEPSDVLLASTGVIGRRYPMDRVRAHLRGLAAPFGGRDTLAAARAIMTTDTVPKIAEAQAGAARVVGIAKGVGMIEPDMATLITLFVTDAEVGTAELDQLFRRVIDRTFNALSIDTDTSTSDTAAIMASGAAGPVAAGRPRGGAARRGPLAHPAGGAGRRGRHHPDRGQGRRAPRTTRQAKRVAKAIVNSPLVKTAVHGADPNWGRVAMAIGKCSDDADIDQERVVIRFGGQEVYPRPVDEEGLSALSRYMKGDEVLIHVSLGIGDGAFTVYGCDLSDQYVRINADYTT